MRRSTNTSVRALAALNNVSLGEVAEQLGLTATGFSIGYMAAELQGEMKQRVVDAIREIVQDRGEQLQTEINLN